MVKKCPKMAQNFMKIRHYQIIYSCGRQKVGKNLMRHTGKVIFDRNYCSQDITQSLDTFFVTFGQNHNFADENVETG